MALPAQKDPDLPDVWLLGLWLALSVFWFFICQGYTPPAHVAYWRETTTIAAGLGLGFTVLLGFTRPAGWLAFLSMVALIYSMPAIGSDSICLFFWIAYYFTVVFSAGNSLTLRKMVKSSVISGLLIGYGYGYGIDPGSRPEHLAQGMLAWLSLLAVMMLVNGVLRLLRRQVLQN